MSPRAKRMRSWPLAVKVPQGYLYGPSPLAFTRYPRWTRMQGQILSGIRHRTLQRRFSRRIQDSELLPSRKPGCITGDRAYPDRRRGRSSDRPDLGTRCRGLAASASGRARADLKVGPYTVLSTGDNGKDRGVPGPSRIPGVARQITRPRAQRPVSDCFPAHVRSSAIEYRV